MFLDIFFGRHQRRHVRVFVTFSIDVQKIAEMSAFTALPTMTSRNVEDELKDELEDKLEDCYVRGFFAFRGTSGKWSRCPA